MKLRERLRKFLKKKKVLPNLSIIIPTLNEEKYLPKLLDSLLKQTYQKYEVIVIDGNSKDKTKEVANKYKKRMKLRFYIEKRKGNGLARNAGERKAKFNNLLFMDSDVILRQKKFLEKTVREFTKRKLVGATCRIKPISGDVRDKFIFSFFSWLIVGLQRIHPLAQGVCIFATKTAHNKIKGFNEKIHAEDVDYVKRVSDIGKFRVLKGVVHTSVRRLKTEGRLIFFLKYLAMGAHHATLGPLSRKYMPYEFGKYK